MKHASAYHPWRTPLSESSFRTANRGYAGGPPVGSAPARGEEIVHATCDYCRKLKLRCACGAQAPLKDKTP